MYQLMLNKYSIQIPMPSLDCMVTSMDKKRKKHENFMYIVHVAKW